MDTANTLAMLAAASASHQHQVQVAIECGRQSQQAAFFAVQASIRARNQAAAPLFSDWTLGSLPEGIAVALGFSSTVLLVFNTWITRHHVAKRHPGDVDFIMQQTIHAIANPYMYRRSLQDENRIELVGWCVDQERTLHMTLEAPPASPPEKGAHGWLQVSAMRFGKAKRRQAENKGGWTQPRALTLQHGGCERRAPVRKLAATCRN